MGDHSAYTDAEPELRPAMSASWLPESALPRHVKITGVAPALGFERCEDASCVVGADGSASSCGRLACPACGCGGTNLTGSASSAGSGNQFRCTCGHSWGHDEVLFGAAPALVLSD